MITIYFPNKKLFYKNTGGKVATLKFKEYIDTVFAISSLDISKRLTLLRLLDDLKDYCDILQYMNHEGKEVLLWKILKNNKFKYNIKDKVEKPLNKMDKLYNILIDVTIGNINALDFINQLKYNANTERFEISNIS